MKDKDCRYLASTVNAFFDSGSRTEVKFTKLAVKHSWLLTNTLALKKEKISAY